MSTLAVVIVTYNSAREIGACLTALAEARPAMDHEIVVVDNASTDDTVARVRRDWPSVDLVEAGANLGFAAGNNVGIRRTTGSLVLLLNPDTRVTPGAIDRLALALFEREDAAVAGPRIVDGTGRAELSFGPMLSPLNDLGQMLLRAATDRGVPVVVRRVERMTRQPRTVDWVTGACLLIRRRDLEAVGLLDERFFLYAEDVDLCTAVRASGRTVLFVPDAEVVHLRGRSATSAQGAALAAARRSRVQFYEKHRPRWVPALKAYLALRGHWPPPDEPAPEPR
jgi:GT2 family glycosyltransferase